MPANSTSEEGMTSAHQHTTLPSQATTTIPSAQPESAPSATPLQSNSATLLVGTMAFDSVAKAMPLNGKATLFDRPAQEQAAEEQGGRAENSAEGLSPQNQKQDASLESAPAARAGVSNRRSFTAQQQQEAHPEAGTSAVLGIAPTEAPGDHGNAANNNNILSTANVVSPLLQQQQQQAETSGFTLPPHMRRPPVPNLQQHLIRQQPSYSTTTSGGVDEVFLDEIPPSPMQNRQVSTSSSFSTLTMHPQSFLSNVSSISSLTVTQHQSKHDLKEGNKSIPEQSNRSGEATAPTASTPSTMATTPSSSNGGAPPSTVNISAGGLDEAQENEAQDGKDNGETSVQPEAPLHPASTIRTLTTGTATTCTTTGSTVLESSKGLTSVENPPSQTNENPSEGANAAATAPALDRVHRPRQGPPPLPHPSSYNTLRRNRSIDTTSSHHVALENLSAFPQTRRPQRKYSTDDEDIAHSSISSTHNHDVTSDARGQSSMNDDHSNSSSEGAEFDPHIGQYVSWDTRKKRKEMALVGSISIEGEEEWMWKLRQSAISSTALARTPSAQPGSFALTEHSWDTFHCHRLRRRCFHVVALLVLFSLMGVSVYLLYGRYGRKHGHGPPYNKDQDEELQGSLYDGNGNMTTSWAPSVAPSPYIRSESREPSWSPAKAGIFHRNADPAAQEAEGSPATTMNGGA